MSTIISWIIVYIRKLFNFTKLYFKIMKIPAKCPICATYVDTDCVVYTGSALGVLSATPPMSLTDALKGINTTFVNAYAAAEKIANKTNDLYSNRFSGVKYPSTSAVFHWVSNNYQPLLGFVPENVDNKSIDLVADQNSDVKYPSVKAVFEYAATLITAANSTFQRISNISQNIVADQTSTTKYPSVKALFDYATTLITAANNTFEILANKSTNIVADQASNTKYPSVKSVFDYAATLIAAANSTFEALSNKSTNTSLGTSNTLYPTQNAVKVYVDTAIAAVPTPNLQQVTDTGNITSNPIVVSTGVPFDGVIRLEPSTILSSTTPRIGIQETTGLGNFELLIEPRKITHLSGQGGEFEINFPVTIDPYVQNFPKGDGTFALSVNSISADADGNVDLGGWSGNITVGSQTLTFTNGILTSVV